MSVVADLTDEEVEEIDRRLRERRMQQTAVPAQPSLPQPGSFDHAKRVADERRLAERRAAARAREEEEARKLADEDERKRQEWRNNATRRAQAKVELEQVESELAERERLLSKQSELLRIVRYPYDAAGAREAEREEPEAAVQ